MLKLIFKRKIKSTPSLWTHKGIIIFYSIFHLSHIDGALGCVPKRSNKYEHLMKIETSWKVCSWNSWNWVFWRKSRNLWLLGMPSLAAFPTFVKDQILEIFQLKLQSLKEWEWFSWLQHHTWKHHNNCSLVRDYFFNSITCINRQICSSFQQ